MVRAARGVLLPLLKRSFCKFRVGPNLLLVRRPVKKERCSRARSKRPGTPVSRKENVQGNSSVMYFRPSSSIIKTPPRTPQKSMSPAVKINADLQFLFVYPQF